MAAFWQNQMNISLSPNRKPSRRFWKLAFVLTVKYFAREKVGVKLQ
jgi:hypothetical protein